MQNVGISKIWLNHLRSRGHKTGFNFFKVKSIVNDIEIELLFCTQLLKTGSDSMEFCKNI